MQENDSARFKIRLDEDEIEPIEPQKEATEKAGNHIRKVNRRITILALLLLVFTGLVAGLGYYDLKQKLAALQNSGQTDVEKLSSQLSASISALSQQGEQLKEESAKLNERLGKEIEAVTKQINSLSKKLEKESTEMRSVAAEAVDKKSLNAAAAELNKKIESIHNSLQAGTGEIKALDEKLARELGVFTQRIRVLDSENDRLQKELNDQAKNRIDQGTLKAALEKQQAQYREELQKLSQSLESKIRTMDRKSEPAPVPATKPPAASSLNKMPVTTSPSPGPIPKVQAPVQKPAGSRSSDIVEQNIE